MGLFNLKHRKEEGGGTEAVSGGGGGGDSIARMEAAFDKAIEKSARITEITTEKKADLDASKQRPQN
ncbi:hypothetical protein SAMN05661010_02734 [Modicisalibacter muralis]|uniref:Uncharacterized protein n=1 Tax=Modicisalibacter muralis TaxID=119000 RepID=A0A1G9NIW7_9GAMM|nr:hypothetical protein [Halomonas muralis]SDL86522.1 hypothetical protein SAMN05661010_02734 [Halomonas muralis]